MTVAMLAATILLLTNTVMFSCVFYSSSGMSCGSGSPIMKQTWIAADCAKCANCTINHFDGSDYS